MALLRVCGERQAKVRAALLRTSRELEAQP